MPQEEADEQPQVNKNEEWQARNSRHLPNLRHKDVQDRQKLKQQIKQVLENQVFWNVKAWFFLSVCPLETID